MNKNLNGIFPPITTPFDADGRLLTDRLIDNLDRWSETRLAGYTVLGSNGECVVPLRRRDARGGRCSAFKDPWR